MTGAKYNVEQNRIDNVEWLGVSRRSSVPSLLNNAESPAQKTPLFYLKSVSTNSYDDDIYFVNNTEQTLRFVAPFKLYQNLNDANVTLSERSESTVHKAKLYADDMPRLYTEVLSYQGVRIGRTHRMSDSDALRQWFIQVPYKSVDSHYALWCFNGLEKDGIGASYPLLWDDFSKPSPMVNCEAVSERGEMPIEPSLYNERCSVFDSLMASLGVADALLVLAINDVLYRYCIGWSAPYNESDIQAKDIARQLQQLKPTDAVVVKTIVQKVYDFWFDKGFAKNISEQACTEILDLYQAWCIHTLK